MMFDLPKSTEFNKRIPKQKFYENLQITPALKKCFVEQIKTIYWRNKIATTTVNLAPGESVTEVEVFVINLNGGSLDENVLKQIDREVPYHILFLLEYEGKVQAWIGYKEASAGNTAFKVNRYYHTDWMLEEDLPLKLEGLTIDEVYENFVRQIAGEALQDAKSCETLKEAIDRSERRILLENQIAALQTKIKREKQLNVQMQLNTRLKRMKKELAEI